MHNLFLRIAKRTVKQWKESAIISSRDYETLQDKVDSVIVHSKIGRIPRKISSCFMFFYTADEWKNWTVIHSVYALHGILPSNHYYCWCLFVKACRILLHARLTETEVKLAQNYLVQFFVKFQALYGTENCTSNMYMACHLEECILDYGLLSSFWCFPFERLNGVVEGMKKSWILLEKQMFRKFSGLQQCVLIKEKNFFVLFMMKICCRCKMKWNFPHFIIQCQMC